jgi:hypothetical protein
MTTASKIFHEHYQYNNVIHIAVYLKFHKIPNNFH